MGLDSVELLQRIEKHFDISIPDKEAEKIITVSDMANSVAKRIAFNFNNKCKSQLLFYRLREYCARELNFKPDKFTLGTLLSEFIPDANRLEIWKKMSKDLSIELPGLKKTDFRDSKYYFTDKIFPSRPTIMNRTVADFIGWILILNYESLINANDVFTLNEIEKIVMGITCNQIGVDVLEIKSDHSFVYDLGVS